MRSSRRSSRPAGLLAVVGVLCSFLSTTAAAQSPSAGNGEWKHGPFEASPEAVYAHGVEHSQGSDAPAVMLFHGVKYVFAADGRLEIRRHWIYRILRDEALKDWSVSQMRWSPWHQEKPEIRARVIHPGGRETWTEADAFVEEQAPESADGLRGDRRLLSARLPGVEAGTVVEEEIVLRESRPAFPWGTAHRHYTSLFIPTVHGKVELDASTRLALRYGARKMPGLEPTSSEVADGRVRVVFDVYDLPAVETAEEGLPGHRPRYPHIAFSTGRSWNWVATGLGQLFEKALTRTRLDALAGDLPSPSDPLDERLSRILATVRERVRYNGLEINASSLDPDPDRVLAAGEGDGFDIALTLVAALRRVGLESSPALVSAGFGADIEPRMPGFGLFNQALVRVVPGPGEDPVWIDPVAPFSRPGELPLASQGRYALVVGPQTEKPIRTPAAVPEDNLAREVRQIHFADFGPGRIVERCEYYGSAERSQRRITEGLEASTRRRGYEAYVHAFHRAAGLGELRETAARDLSTPFVLELEAVDSNRALTTLEHAVLEIPVRELARRMPPVFLEAENAPRREEYVFPEPFVTEWRYEVHPPPGFVVEVLPADEELRLGPATYSHRFRRDEGGERILVDLRFDVGQRLLAPAQFSELRRELKDFLERPTLDLRFASVATGLLDGGQLKAAFRELQRAVEQEPDRPGRRIHLSQAALRAGMTGEAERQARRAVALAPEWALAHWALAVTLEHDELGRRFAAGAPLKKAAEALEQAVRLAPRDPLIRAEYPRLLLRSADGRPGLGAEIEDAVKVFWEYRKDFGKGDLDREMVRLFTLERRWMDLKRLLEATDPESPRHLAATVAASGRLPETPLADPEEVALELVRGREYELARRVWQASGLRVPTWVEGLQRGEELELPARDPRTPVRKLILALGSRIPEREPLVAALHPRLMTRLEARDLDVFRRDFAALVPSEARDLEPSGGLWEDLVLAGFEPELAGAPHLGYRVGRPGMETVFFLGRAGDELRIVATGSLLAELGVEALDRLEQGDLPGARRRLDWARELLPPDPAEDPLAVEPLRFLWPATREGEPSWKELRIAAAALAAPADRSGVSLQILQAAVPGEASGEIDERKALALDAARLHAFTAAGAYLDLEALSGSLTDRYPTSTLAFQRQVEALTALGEWQTFVSRAEARLRRYPGDLDAHRALGHWALRLPDAEAAHEHFSVVRNLGKLTAVDAGTWIFALLAAPSPNLEEAREILAQTEAEGREDALWLRAAAVLAAESGRPEEARRSLIKALDIQGTDSLTVEDGFLLGRIAEEAGLLSAARDLYGRLLSNRELKNRSPLVYLLTQRAVERLKTTAG